MRSIIDSNAIISRHNHLKIAAEDSTSFIKSYKGSIKVSSGSALESFTKSLPYMLEQHELGLKELHDYEITHAEYFI